MGSGPSKPEFKTFLADKHVPQGNNIILSCEANTEAVTASWEKDGQNLHYVEGKHKANKIGTKCVLEILNSEQSDEGNYIVTLSNSAGSESCSGLVRIMINEWRTVQWKQDGVLKDIKTFQICNKVEELRFLLFGPVGTGKSSTINTIRSILEGRLFINCLAAAESSTTHTTCFERYRFANEGGSFPFTFNDVMGAEQEKADGLQTADIITALKGHMKEGYMFNTKGPLLEGNSYYNPKPTLSDQMHCLVYVIAADRLPTMTEVFFKKLGSVRETASKMKIPQVIFLTRVDLTCPLVKENLQNIYKSKKIKESMIKCSHALNLPMNCIFPILNYHQETDMNEDINCLMLNVLKNIVHFANDYVVSRSNNQTSLQHVISE